LDILKYLLDMGSDVNTANNLGNTPLHYTNAYGFSKCSDLLLKYGSNERIKNNRGVRPWEGI
jgi:ankyrin repeat protein